MRFAYLTYDEVNEHWAQKFANARDMRLDVLTCRDITAAPNYDAVLCDLDSLPPAERAATLAALLKCQPKGTVAVHSYNITTHRARRLRRCGVIVVRRLRAGVFGRLVAVVSARQQQQALALRTRGIGRSHVTLVRASK
jgi:hypothetical protein